MRLRAVLAFSTASFALSTVAACVLDSTIQSSAVETCTEAKDCSDDDNACTVTKCESGVCKYPALPEGTPPPQIAGDCKLAECDGTVQKNTDDPTDVDDGNDCTADVCDGGQPSHPNAETGAPCFVGSAHGECDGMGTCVVECSTDLPCPIDPNQPCGDPVCDKQNKCKYTPRTGAPLVAVPDTMGDCLGGWCDAGVLGTIADDTDTPPDDGLECTVEGCNAGVPEHTPKTTGDACGAGGALFCDASGQCKGCLVDAHCGAPEECAVPTCAVAAGTCSDVPKSSGTPCSTGVCDGSGTCVACVAPSDCPLQPDPCLTRTCTSNMCGTGFSTSGTTCGAMMDDACNGAGTCVDCVDAGDCTELVVGECQVAQCNAANTCVVGSKPMLTPCTTGGTVCDGGGACVACLTGAQCAATPATPLCCPNHTCAATCP
jgi:hypothetical protein